MNNTTTIPSGKDIQRKWFVLDATGKTLGRLSTQAASILAGKNNVLYTPYIDMGDHVIVVNCEKIVLTGLKADSKLYRRYTGFPGGLREESFIKLLARRPEAIVEQAVKGMLPKSKLGRQMAPKLKVYKGPQHPHLAQQRAAATRSLGISDSGETFDVITTVKGGGVMGQADAVKLGIARALMVFNPELRKALKAEGLVTRDSRGKERKKYGQKGARARFQFSKR